MYTFHEPSDEKTMAVLLAVERESEIWLSALAVEALKVQKFPLDNLILQLPETREAA